jgi:hypothetical protein
MSARFRAPGLKNHHFSVLKRRGGFVFWSLGVLTKKGAFVRAPDLKIYNKQCRETLGVEGFPALSW